MNELSFSSLFNKKIQETHQLSRDNNTPIPQQLHAKKKGAKVDNQSFFRQPNGLEIRYEGRGTTLLILQDLTMHSRCTNTSTTECQISFTILRIFFSIFLINYQPMVHVPVRHFNKIPYTKKKTNINTKTVQQSQYPNNLSTHPRSPT